jgi:hypothetical protein
MRWVGKVAKMKDGRSAFQILTDKAAGKRSLRSPALRWEDNICIYFNDISVIMRNWID